MASKRKPQVPEHAQTGVWVNILGALFPLTQITTKTVTEKIPTLNSRGAIVSIEEVKTVVSCVPYWSLVDHRETERVQHGYNRLAGRLCAEGSTRDNWDGQNDACVGDTYAIVDGTVIPVTLEAGLTGGADANVRKPKFDIPGGLYVEVDDEAFVLTLGVSQTFTRRKPYVMNGLFVWSKFAPYNTARAEESVAVEAEQNLTDASSLFAQV